MESLTGLTNVDIALILAAALIAGYPIWRILHRMGWGHRSAIAWTITMALPVVSIFAWWYLAFTAWPNDDLSWNPSSNKG